ncbi:MAG: hypothetical protein ACE5NM_04215 [Sedimentisphaerales bacterium]
MFETSREIQELLVDYAGALRDGCIPTFLKSLSRDEADKITTSREFWDATEMVRILNSVGFAEKAVTPNVSLFISRVDAEIASRSKKTKAVSRSKRSPRAFLRKQERRQSL